MTTKQNNTGENKRVRNYAKEYELTKKRTKRLRVDMDIRRADLLADLLRSKGLTLAEWLRNKIDQEMQGAK